MKNRTSFWRKEFYENLLKNSDLNNNQRKYIEGWLKGYSSRCPRSTYKQTSETYNNSRNSGFPIDEFDYLTLGWSRGALDKLKNRKNHSKKWDKYN